MWQYRIWTSEKFHDQKPQWRKISRWIPNRRDWQHLPQNVPVAPHTCMHGYTELKHDGIRVNKPNSVVHSDTAHARRATLTQFPREGGPTILKLKSPVA